MSPAPKPGHHLWSAATPSPTDKDNTVVHPSASLDAHDLLKGAALGFDAQDCAAELTRRMARMPAELRLHHAASMAVAATADHASDLLYLRKAGVLSDDLMQQMHGFDLANIDGPLPHADAEAGQ